jgi:hypothetical protein
VDQQRDRKEPRGKNRSEKPLKMGLGLVWHNFLAVEKGIQLPAAIRRFKFNVEGRPP